MSEEKKEYNTIEEDDMTQNETEEILEEDDVKLAEETVSETEETEETVEEKTAEKKGLFGKKKKDKKDEKIEELLYDLIVQVVQITNRVVHGQDVDDQYIGFVKKIYPDMVNMINKIGRNLKSEGNNKSLSFQGH